MMNKKLVKVLTAVLIATCTITPITITTTVQAKTYHRTLRMGSQGEDVKELQRTVSFDGFYFKEES